MLLRPLMKKLEVHVQAPGHNKGPAARQGAVCQDFGFFFLCHEMATWGHMRATDVSSCQKTPP